MITIQKQICLEPKYFDKDIKNHLYEKIKMTMIGNCDQEYGYIMEISPSVTILENFVATSTTGVFFTVKFNAKTIKPEINQIYDCTITKIFPHGIFAEVHKIKILIPADKVTNFVFDKVSQTFKFKKTELKVGDEIKVEIEKERYEKQNFKCIGKLI